MKKRIALLLALMMTFSLVGCASGPDILGTYKTTFDMTDIMVTEFDLAAGISPAGLSLGDYMSEFKLIIYYEFKEDGTYSQSYNADSLDTGMANMESALIPLLDDLIFETMKAELNAYGQTAETKDDVAAVLGMDWNAVFPSIFGVTAAEYAAQLMEETKSTFNMDDYMIDGNYKAEGGKLYMTTSPEEEIIETAYETYEISGDTVTITGGVNIEEESLLPYPYVLTKISE